MRIWKVEMRDNVDVKQRFGVGSFGKTQRTGLGNLGEESEVENGEKEQHAAQKCVACFSLKEMMLKKGKVWGFGVGCKGELWRENNELSSGHTEFEVPIGRPGAVIVDYCKEC